MLFKIFRTWQLDALYEEFSGKSARLAAVSRTVIALGMSNSYYIDQQLALIEQIAILQYKINRIKSKLETMK